MSFKCIAVAFVLLFVTCTSLAGAAAAAPAVILPALGERSQSISSLSGASDGSLWLLQRWVLADANALGERFRVVHVAVGGSVSSTTVISGYTPQSRVLSSPDGGAWVSVFDPGVKDALRIPAERLNYVRADGSTLEIAYPEVGSGSNNYARGTVAPTGDYLTVGCGADSQNWSSVDFSYDWSLGCAAIFVANDGAIRLVPLPQFDRTGHAVAGDRKTRPETDGVSLTATASGMWAIKDGRAVFVRYDGSVRDIGSWPSARAVVGAATGDDVWWSEGKWHQSVRVGATRSSDGSDFSVTNLPVDMDVRALAVGPGGGVADLVPVQWRYRCHRQSDNDRA